MGDYTPTFKFYKPDGDEFIDPEIQLNRNWDIADTLVKRALEYEYTSLKTPPTQGTLPRSRFYKAYSGSVVAWMREFGGYFWQDSLAYVSTFTSGKSWIGAGWFDHPDFPLAARIIRTTVGGKTEIEWNGCIWQNGAVIPSNTNLIPIPTGNIPLQYRPAVPKYFEVSAGNTSTQYSIARVYLSTDGRMEIKRYGDDPPGNSAENRIELTGIKYDVAVGA